MKFWVRPSKVLNRDRALAESAFQRTPKRARNSAVSFWHCAINSNWLRRAKRHDSHQRFRQDCLENANGNILPRCTPPQALATVDAMRTYTDTATNEIFSRMGQAGPSPTDLRARREHARVQARRLSVGGRRCQRQAGSSPTDLKARREHARVKSRRPSVGDRQRLRQAGSSPIDLKARREHV